MVKRATDSRRTFTCRLPENLYRALRVRAAEEGTSSGKVLIAALELLLGNREK